MDNEKVYEKVIDENSDMAFAGIVCGNNTGKIWLNDSLKPTVCLVWSDYLEGFSVMGIKGTYPTELEWISFVRETILSFLEERKMEYCELSCEKEEWIPLLSKTFSGYQRRTKESILR